MDKPDRHTFKVAVLWRGDPRTAADVPPETSRLHAVFAALERQGMAAEPMLYSEAAIEELCERLLLLDGVLVWVDPISEGQRRTALDGLLRQVAENGVFVSAHPDVILKMGVKEVLYRTRELGWGTDTDVYDTEALFKAKFPGRVAAGPRVLKQSRGNGGIGVWKVEGVSGGTVRVQEAKRDSEPRELSLPDLVKLCRQYFEDGGRLIDQPFQARHLEGMIRCYMSGSRVVGFGHQLVRALAPPEAGPASPRLYSGPDDTRFQRLRRLMERQWASEMADLLEIDPAALPVIWDADFLLGPKTPEGDDSYVLCEINASSVFPIPDEAPAALAETVHQRLTANRKGRRAIAPAASASRD